jgi:hypothetical protein
MSYYPVNIRKFGTGELLYPVNVLSTNTVLDVIEGISMDLDSNVNSNWKLFFRDNPILNQMTLADYSIGRGADLYLREHLSQFIFC